MNSMAIDRRSLLLGTLAFVGRRRWVERSRQARDDSRICLGGASRGRAIIACCCCAPTDRSFARCRSRAAATTSPSTGRPAASPLFARRPGTFAVAFELDERDAAADFHARAKAGTTSATAHFPMTGDCSTFRRTTSTGGRGVIGIYDVAREYQEDRRTFELRHGAA